MTDRPLPAQFLDQPRIHLHRLLQLLDRNPLADGVGLVDVAGAEYQRVHTTLIARGFGTAGNGDRTRRAGRAAGRMRQRAVRIDEERTAAVDRVRPGSPPRPTTLL